METISNESNETILRGHLKREGFKLTDKKNTPYRLDKPSEYLSQRAIDRRKKQHLMIDSTDLPISPVYLAAISGCEKVQVVGKSKWNNSVLIKCNHPTRSLLVVW